MLVDFDVREQQMMDFFYWIIYFIDVIMDYGLVFWP